MPEGRSLISRLRDAADYRLVHRVPVKTVPSRLDRPIASFTFDDFPRSAFLAGGKILERHGVRGTYYVSGSLCAQVEHGEPQFEMADLRDLLANGHEVGDHGFHHWHIPHHSPADWRIDCARNSEFIREALGDFIPSSFAYPFGHVSLRAKQFYARRYGSCRGTTPGINHGTLDLGQLKSMGLGRESIAALDLDDLFARTCARNGWLIFYLHDVKDDPGPYGVTESYLESVVAGCLAAGIEILPMRNALARACFVG